MKVTPCGKWLVTASADGRVRVWNTETWTTHAVLSHCQGIRSVALGVADSELQVLTGDLDGRLIAWSLDVS